MNMKLYHRIEVKKEVPTCNPIVCPHFSFDMCFAVCTKMQPEKVIKYDATEGETHPDWCPLPDIEE